MSLATREVRSGRGRRPDPRKRDAIVEAARQLFLQQGYGASMDAIAEAAGVSKQTIYNAFSSKEELFAAIIGEAAEAITAPLADGRAERQTPEEVLRDFAQHLFAVVLSPRALALWRVLVAQRGQFPDMGEAFYRAGPGVTHARLARYLARQAELGRLAVEDASVAAEHFVGMLNGKRHLQRLLGIEEVRTPAELERHIHLTVAAFLRAYAR